jgi:DNA-binding Lrp family transcriptional regulator
MGGKGSGVKRKEVDMNAALDLIMRGETIPTVAEELGISPPTLRARVADISKKQGLLLQYRSVQSLQLTELQARVLEAITPEKIAEANLRDLVMSYKILKDKEQVMEGKPSEIKGLVAHLIHLEKMETVGEKVEDFEEAEFSSEEVVSAAPKSLVEELADLDDSTF